MGMKSKKNVVYFLALLSVFMFPVVLYICNFGFHLSNDHERWGQAGDFLGAAYGSITAIVTLIILALQIKLQSEYGEHEKVRAHLDNSRSDLSYYIDRLSSILKSLPENGNEPLSRLIVDGFSQKDLAYLKSDVAIERFKFIYDRNDSVVALWSAINISFSTSKMQEDDSFKLFYESSKGKCIAMFGFAMCEALDNLYYAGAGERSAFEFSFSRVLGSN